MSAREQMTVKKSELSQILLDIDVCRSALEVIAPEISQRLSKDFEVISLLCKHLEEVNK